MDQPAALFQSIESAADVKRFVMERESESLVLEFKEKNDRSVPDLSGQDPLYFSKALSGFANSGGGVLVWGVATDKADGKDRAASTKPIARVAEFERRLLKSLINACQPFVDGVEMRVLPDDAEEAGSGYLAVLIPESDKMPHRAMLAGREYYKRSAEGFYRMEHFDLEDAFGRRPRPLLQVVVSSREAPDKPLEYEVTFKYKNEGRGLAKYPVLNCRFDDPATIVSTTGEIANISEQNGGRALITHQNDHAVIHAMSGRSLTIGTVNVRRPTHDTIVRGHLHWGCEAMRERTLSFSISSGTPKDEG